MIDTYYFLYQNTKLSQLFKSFDEIRHQQLRLIKYIY